MPPGKPNVTAGTGPPKANTPPPIGGPNTRRTIRTQPTAEEIIATPNNVMDTDSAEKFLSSKLLCQEGQPYSLTHLVSILFHITQMSATTPLPVVSAIRAVAFILKKHTACEIAEAAARQLADTLSDAITGKIVDHAIAALAPQIASLHSASEALAVTAKNAEDTLTTSLDKTERIHRLAKDERTEQEGGVSIAAERLEEVADALYASVSDCQNAINVLAPSLDVTQERVNRLSTQMLATPPPTLTPVQPSYSTIAAAHLPPKVDQAVGRAAIRARQILLDPNPGTPPFPPNTTSKEIAEHLKKALTNIRNDSTPEGNVKTVTTLRNGGIIVELDSDTLATWLRDPANRTLLENQFDSAVSFRSRTFALVLEYLPIHLQISDGQFLRRLEEENTLLPDSLASIRWIKPPIRRSPQQRKAFALLQVAEACTANSLLRDGLCIDNERITIRKDKKEPIRCAKCQRYGHIARSCSDTIDTCGTCGGQHRTMQCNAFKTTRCVNCRNNDHTSWSRKCPEFKRRCELLDEKFPENRMPYFPTETAWTHAIAPPKPPRAPTPTHHSPDLTRPNKDPRTTHQTTLNFKVTDASEHPPTPSQEHPTTRTPPTSTEIMNELYPLIRFDDSSTSSSSSPTPSASVSGSISPSSSSAFVSSPQNSVSETHSLTHV